MNQSSTFLVLCKRGAAVCLCSSVALTPGRQPDLALDSICSGTLSAFQRNPERNAAACFLSHSSPTSATVNTHTHTHTASVCVCGLRQVIVRARLYSVCPDYRWKVFDRGRAFHRPGPPPPGLLLRRSHNSQLDLRLLLASSPLTRRFICMLFACQCGLRA